MFRIFGAQFYSLITSRAVYIVYVAVACVIAFGTLVQNIFMDDYSKKFYAPNQYMEDVLGGQRAAAGLGLLFLIWAAYLGANMYENRSVLSFIAAYPSRIITHLSHLGSILLIFTSCMLISFPIAIAIHIYFVSTHLGQPMSQVLGAMDFMPYVEFMFLCLCSSALGWALGVIVRNTAGAVALYLGYQVFATNIVKIIPRNWWPKQGGSSSVLFSTMTTNLGSIPTPGQTVGTETYISGLGIFLWSAIAVIVALWASRRDIA